MKITDIKIQVVAIPLITTFKTALRTVSEVKNVLVTVHTDSSLVGFGGAAPAAVITGDTVSSIIGGIEHIRDNIVGMDIDHSENILQRLNNCLIGSMSAKAAVDMAVYDLMAKSLNIPLFQLLGGRTHDVQTDMTISIDSPEKMAAESTEKVGQGFTTLKIKVGGDPKLDIQRLQSIRDAVGSEIPIMIDANQGWSGKEAVQVGRELERRGIAIELMEQPVSARDFAGLRYVRDNVAFPVYADESIFSAQDALQLVGMHAVDGLNIKLMKCGGIYNALKIIAIAETAGIPCMIGSMMESHVSVTAAAHLAASRTIIGRADLDAALFCSFNPAQGGISYQGARVIIPETPGLGIAAIAR
ncbi:dipeptide epimerase [Desulfopila sp. IMCC35006]|uniref:dipeptide epimerase n=1 Tax=Desulfopila sp. IMCC35006 TaxID=2569542 RepID=UPI0010AC2B19|nr:dipeptide epimerase [Desulfopila sp. IMCC35006]TKB25369.1 dipeptide epimerase [Desulfopila sp. IMCC35006]